MRWAWLAPVLLVGVLYVIYSGMLKNAFKKGLEAAGPRVAGVATRVADVKLSPLSGRGEVLGVFVGSPEGFRAPSVIEIGRAKVEVRASTLLSDKVVIRSVRIEDMEVTYERRLSGSNLSKIQETLEATLGAGKERSSGGEPRRLRVDEFGIRGGRVRGGLTALGGRGAVKRLPEIRLLDLGADDRGITPGELADLVLRAIVRETAGALGEAALGLGQRKTPD
jgi:hypothetical protein